MNERPRILVVDDEPDIVEILLYNLKKEDYQVETATDGAECLQKAHAHVPDLIILDIRMHGRSGIDVCRELKQDEVLKSVPVLFLTADSDEYTTMQAADAGGEHFITKPIRPSIIIGLVKEILQTSESQQ
jgi:two-component system alkaline phosphatase synthesis response regulator PhoP